MTSPACVLHPDQYAGSTCPRCGNFTCGTCNPDGRTQCPSCRALQADTQRADVPWERRAELGLPAAFWAQLTSTLLSPGRFWKTVRRDRPGNEAFFFAWLVSAVANLASVPFNAFNIWVQGEQLRELFDLMLSRNDTTALLELLFAHPVLSSLVLAVWGVLMFPVSFFLMAGLVHLGCILAGIRNHPLGVTVRAVGYGSAGNALLAIPFVGFLGAFYTWALWVWGVKELQQGSTGRSVVAVFWWMLLVCCCSTLAVGAVAVWAFSMVRGVH